MKLSPSDVALMLFVAAIGNGFAQAAPKSLHPGHSCVSHAQIPMSRAVAAANGWTCINCNGELLPKSLATPDKKWGPPYVVDRICKVYVSPQSNTWYGDGSTCAFSYVKGADPC